jgi:hypothetical protein
MYGSVMKVGGNKEQYAIDFNGTNNAIRNGMTDRPPVKKIGKA